MSAIAPKPTRRLGDTSELLYEEAQRLNVETRGRSEEEVRQAVRAAWMEENRAAIDGVNAWVEKHGLPLAKHRQF
jgi:antitoxin CcdA